MNIQIGPNRLEAVNGYIHSVETLGTVDGPGVRYVIFTQGCPMRCLYCHNPDTFRMKQGRQVSSSELLADIRKAANFLRRARGGVTISGGEPLFQTKFLTALLRGCKAMKLHTAIDTTGFPGKRTPDSLLADVDLVLLDIKSFDPLTHSRVTGVDVQPTLDFAHRLSDMGKPMWIRFVLVPGLTDAPENIEGMADFVATLDTVERVEILPFHKLGEYKWQELGLPYVLADTPSPTAEAVRQAQRAFSSRGLKVV